MTLPKKKGASGYSAAFISRSRALSRLQLPLSTFRRLCILKGIYPRDPPNMKKLIKVAPGKGGVDQTFYALKDIQYLNADPLVLKMREERAWRKRAARWRAKGELSGRRLASKPTYTLDHLVRERYPTFSDALKDMDDALSMIALFAVLPMIPNLSTGEASQIRDDYSQECSRLYQEFLAAITATHSLESSFISIRGIYYRAVVCGVPITWITPHERCIELPQEVDFRVMLSFVEWWMVVLGFVNFRLFARLGWKYPLQVGDKEERQASILLIKPSPKESNEAKTIMSLNPFHSLPDIKSDSEHALQLQLMPKTTLIFEHLIFYVNRECPMNALALLIYSHGGTILNLASTPEDMNDMETDPRITHQIVDRPGLQRVFADRVYVQPQWIWDSVNQKKVLPKELYGVGIPLPPHLSPFVSQEEEEEEESEGEGNATERVDDAPLETDKPKTEKKKKLTKEQRQLAISMLSKKQKNVYRRVAGAQERRAEAKAVLASRRHKLTNN
jgi:pescadillo